MSVAETLLALAITKEHLITWEKSPNPPLKYECACMSVDMCLSLNNSLAEAGETHARVPP